MVLTTKKCIIVHGCPSSEEKALDPNKRTYDKHRIPRTKKQATTQGIEVYTPLMPLPWKPDYWRFKAVFEKHEVNKNTVLVGHSCGCAFLVRWLGETKTKILKLILVAPWKIPDEDDDFGRTFYTYDIDGTIKDRVGEIFMFTSDTEEDDGKKSLHIFHDSLGGHIISLKNRGHYCLWDMGTEEFPELLEIIIS